MASYSIRGTFPSPEGYAEFEEVRHMTGGEAANSSIVLSRLGVPVKLDGNWLGADENGERTKAFLSDHQIDTSRLPLKEGYKGVQEVVFAAPGTRVAETAFNAGVPVVTVDCKYDNPLLKHTSAVVIAESFLRENYPRADLKKLFGCYKAAIPGLTVFTFGDAPIWYARPDEAVRYCQPYSIDPVDTTGGGDSFRAGIVYGIMKAWSDDKLIEFAAAVAAITCTRFPGVLNSPTYDEVSAFMNEATRC